MIVYASCAHKLHNLVEAFRRKTLKEGIGFSCIPDTVYDITALLELIDHIRNNADIILKIRIDRNSGIHFIPYRHKSCKERILMTDVTGQLKSLNGFILMGIPVYYAPGIVPAPVIDIQDEAFICHPSAFNKPGHKPGQLFICTWQYLLLIIAGHYYCQFDHPSSTFCIIIL